MSEMLGGKSLIRLDLEVVSGCYSAFADISSLYLTNHATPDEKIDCSEALAHWAYECVCSDARLHDGHGSGLH
ncbi:hypothetical protein [Rubritalea tangerina]|uniref:hypothetical protein n=1 Tax=Rubritalea tangerina TaxID=430798 RepID=UPI00361944C3